MLKSTKIEIELLTDVDKLLFIEENIRGGVSYVNQRHCEKREAEGGNGKATDLKLIDGKFIFL
jgi:hypothetical protein